MPRGALGGSGVGEAIHGRAELRRDLGRHVVDLRPVLR